MPIPVLTLQEMKEVERITAIERGIDEYEMILSAGEAVFESLKVFLADKELNSSTNPVAFLCGPGNNGADGLAAARMAHSSGIPVKIWQISSPHPTTENVRLLEQAIAEGVEVELIRSPADLPVFSGVSAIVDALLGTGANRPPEDLLQSLIHGANNGGQPILSIDCPSGVAADSVIPLGTCIRANTTLCLGALKISALFHPAAGYYGKLLYSPICFDGEWLFDRPSGCFHYGGEDAVADLPRRDWSAHKYSAGKVLVIAGSRGMHGAAALAARAAMRTGAGLVKLACPGSLMPHLAPHLLEVIAAPVDSDSWHFHPGHIETLKPLLEWADSIVVGPGLGQAEETLEFLRRLAPLLVRPCVLDGDALKLFQSGLIEPPAESERMRWVATPHAGEFRKMGGQFEPSEPEALIAGVREMTERLNLTMVLKGATTLCIDPNGVARILRAGNPGLATAGSGDVLAGTIAAFLPHLPTEQAAALGVFVHGYAADLAQAEKGTLGLIASDVVDKLPVALFDLETSEEN